MFHYLLVGLCICLLSVVGTVEAARLAITGLGAGPNHIGDNQVRVAGGVERRGVVHNWKRFAPAGIRLACGGNYAVIFRPGCI